MHDIILEMVGQRAFLTALTFKGFHWMRANLPVAFKDQTIVEIDNSSMFGIFIAAESNGLVVG